MRVKLFLLIAILASVLYGVTFENFKKYITHSEISGDRKIYLNLSENYFEEDFLKVKKLNIIIFLRLFIGS